MSYIEVKQLVKEYQRKINPPGITGALKGMIRPVYENLRAVDGVSFSIEEGEAVGYVGPNGSGKSTTIKMLSGILTPTAGKVTVGGLEPSKNRIANNINIGVVFGSRSQLWWDVPVIESFKMLQKMYEIPEKQFRDNLAEFTEILGLEGFINAPERQLSLGQKIRCNITAAFLHNPKTVYLDEPTIGLDAESKSRIREFIRRINQERKTTFLVTSHDFQDIEALCRRIILINHGKVVVDSNIKDVKKEFSRFKTLRAEVEYNPFYGKEWELNLDGVSFLRSDAYCIELEYDVEKTDAMKIITRLSEMCEINDVSIAGRDIESIIRDIINKDESDNMTNI